VESPVRGDTHAGFGERSGETDREQSRHRAPGRLIDTNTDIDDHLDDPEPHSEPDPEPEPDPGGQGACPGEPDTDAPGHTTGPGDPAIRDGQEHDRQHRGGQEHDRQGCESQDREEQDRDGGNCGGQDCDRQDREGQDRGGQSCSDKVHCGLDCGGQDCGGLNGDRDGDGHRADDTHGTVTGLADRADEEPGHEAWDANDWDQPASVFRPDRRTEIPDPDHPGKPASPEKPLATNDSRAGTYPVGTPSITPCPGGRQPRPLPVTIGIVITAQSLFGFSNTPGQLMDRSTLIAANRVRELAQQPGTLFQRLLTDDNGNLLDVTELGRFPSRKLALAVKFRDGTCTGPTCTTPAIRCDIDHVIPVPDGPTTASNLNDNCRHEHRAKTHAGHQSARTSPHTTEWTTPTGHKYTSTDTPFPTEQWPTDNEPAQQPTNDRRSPSDDPPTNDR
jgi:hypothetical protein